MIGCCEVCVVVRLRVLSFDVFFDLLFPAFAMYLQALSTAMYIRLAYQSIGVVYGDLGTSPLYVFSSTFVNGIKDTNDILGALSLILYTITLIPLIKYVFIVLQANDNGEGE